MDAKQKKTLEDFMAAVPEEELTAEKPSDTISLDEPKRRLWLPVFMYLLILIIIAGVAYTGYRVYNSEKPVNAEQKIENSAGEETPESATQQPAIKATTAAVVYVNSEGGLNLRETASTDAAVLTLIPDKTKLSVIEEKDGWLKVTYDGKTGWCSKELTQQP